MEPEFSVGASPPESVVQAGPSDQADRREAFVIMQIGNDEMDRVFAEVIAPAIANAGLVCRRVDQHNMGGLLQAEIAAFIERAAIIVGDLTNERPNCYLEIGYAFGLGRTSSVVLAAREDHKPDRVGRAEGEPKVHFDLGSYDILYWSPDHLSRYRDELTRRIQRRLLISAPRTELASAWDDEWIAQARAHAENGLAEWE